MENVVCSGNIAGMGTKVFLSAFFVFLYKCANITSAFEAFNLFMDFALVTSGLSC